MNVLSTLDLFLLHDISKIVIEYDTCICYDCQTETRNHYECIKCSLSRCAYCYVMNTKSMYCRECEYAVLAEESIVMCVKHPDKIAHYGYEGIICYCELCIHDKKVIKYDVCKKCNYGAEYYDNNRNTYYCHNHASRDSNINYIDLRTKIPKQQLTKKCTSCKKLCTITYVCKCNKQRCLHCFKLETWCSGSINICNFCSYFNRSYYDHTILPFPCSICSIDAQYVDMVNNKYYCVNHTHANKYIYQITFKTTCMRASCYAPSFIVNYACLRHQD